MSGDTYDENLEKNPFFEALRKKAPNLFQQILDHKLYILVPKRDSFKGFSKADPLLVFKRHIVRLEEWSDGEVKYWNLEGDVVSTSNDGQVLTLRSASDGNGFRQSISVRILFEETYFTEDGASCKLICISRPLLSLSECGIDTMPTPLSFELPDTAADQVLTSQISPFPDISVASTSYWDPFQCYNQILFREDHDDKLQKQLRENLRRFTERIANEYRPSWNFEQLKMLVREEYYATLKDTLTISRKRISNGKMDNAGINRLEISTEIFFYRCLHTQLMSLLCACVREDESSLNKMRHMANELAPSDWGITPELYGDLPTARKQLAKLNEIDNPYGKLLCLRKAIGSLASGVRISNGKRVPISTDELIPPLAFLITKSNIFNWITNIRYINEFHFSTYANDELGYCLASFEAAAQFIKDGSMKTVVLARWRDWALGKALNNNQEKDHSTDIAEKEEGPNVADTDYWECLIAALEANDEAAVRDCMNAGMAHGALEGAGHSTTALADGDEMNGSSRKCHPLCECTECLKKRHEGLRYSINCVTAQGFTALHFAALFDKRTMLSYLIRAGGQSLLDKRDECGRTPLHWACRIGSQSCTLLLLHHGAKISLADVAGNTPLHLATYYGYIDCVKALLYFNQQVQALSTRVDSVNHGGETALHIAVRWQHADIVSVILECGANARLRDRRGKTAFDLSENSEIRRLLASVAPFVEHPKLETPPDCQIGSSADIVLNQQMNGPPENQFGHSSFSASCALIDLNIEKIDKLLKAVTDDDLPLVKYYLGGTSGCKEQQRGRCHPLCQCPRCQEFDDALDDRINVNATGTSGLNALHTAVMFRRLEMLRYLLQCCGADVNWPSAADGRTCLHMAATSGNMSIVQLLVEQKADILAKDSSGDTPLHLLVATGNVSLFRYLVSKYGKECANLASNGGDTLLDRAVKENQVHMVNVLLENGDGPFIENGEHSVELW